MTLQIEEGKYYVDGHGNLVGPMSSSGKGFCRGRVESWRGSLTLSPADFKYTQDGIWQRDDLSERKKNDLVREVNAAGSEIHPTVVYDKSLRVFQETWAKMHYRTAVQKAPVCDCGSKYNSGFHSSYCSTQKGS